MAQLVRSAKSGSNWTYYEFYAYNISITPTSPPDFFQSGADPSLDNLDPSILTSPVIDADDPNLSKATSRYLGYLDLATCASQTSAIDFAAATLRLLDFDVQNTTVATRYAIPLLNCGEMRAVQTDVCLIYRPTTTILLVLVEDKTLYDSTAAGQVEAQVVAEAIAAFQHNNDKREEQGRPTLEAMTIPCITMSGTTPTFYLVPVTKELSEAVITGQYPTTHTHVSKSVTTATHRRWLREGMADLEFRKIALKRFLAFKDLAKSYWQEYIV